MSQEPPRPADKAEPALPEKAATASPKSTVAKTADAAKPTPSSSKSIDTADVILSKKEVAPSASKSEKSGVSTVFVVAGIGALIATVACAALVDEARAGGAPAFVGIALSAFSLVFGLGALWSRRKSPRKIGLGAIAALAGAIACAACGALAWLARSPATTPEEIADPGLRAFHVGAAEAGARSAAMFGLAGVVGALLGCLGIWLGIRARKNARASAPPNNLGVESVPAAWTALFGVGVVSLGGIGVDVAALTAPIVHADHPNLARARAVSEAFKRNDLPAACEGLETVLDPDALPKDVLERELPTYREIADRCVTQKIQALPTDLKCAVDAGKLLATRIVRAAGAEDRVKHACTSP